MSNTPPPPNPNRLHDSARFHELPGSKSEWVAKFLDMRERWVRDNERFIKCNKDLIKVHETLYLESRHRLSCIDELYKTQNELRAVKNELRACQRRLEQIGAPVAGGARRTRRRRKNKRRRRTRRK